MFDSDLAITGTPATQIKFLVNEAHAFTRYIDVYMMGAVVGVLNGKTAQAGDSTDRARIYSDAFNTENVKCHEIFKLVILSDKLKDWTEQERINICFRYRDKRDDLAVPPITDEEVNSMKEAFDLFNSYVYGGIDIIYNNFASDASADQNDIVDYAYKAVFDQYSQTEVQAVNEDDLFRPEF